MPVASLVVDGTLGLLTAGVFAFVGRTLWQRRVESDGLRASRLFATWWHGLAVVTALGSGVRVLAGFGALTLPLYEAALYVAFVPLCIALFGLLYYLLFLLTGSSRILLPLAVYYVLLYAYLVALFASTRADGFVAEGWTLHFTYERAPTRGQLWLTMALVLGPHLLAALAYLRLFFALSDPTQRYRVALVSGSILVWSVSLALASEVQLVTWAWWPLVSRCATLAAAFTILFAYLPPTWVRERYHVASVSDDRPVV